MLPFSVQLRPGRPVFDQLVQAFHQALASGLLKNGEAFPSVRTLSRELRISPTTAHKVAAHLKDRGFLVSQPGVGMLISVPELPGKPERLALLESAARKLLTEARDLSLTRADLEGLLKQLDNENANDSKNS